jgi:hypothetical protein
MSGAVGCVLDEQTRYTRSGHLGGRRARPRNCRHGRPEPVSPSPCKEATHEAHADCYRSNQIDNCLLGSSSSPGASFAAEFQPELPDSSCHVVAHRVHQLAILFYKARTSRLNRPPPSTHLSAYLYLRIRHLEIAHEVAKLSEGTWRDAYAEESYVRLQENVQAHDTALAAPKVQSVVIKESWHAGLIQALGEDSGWALASGPGWVPGVAIREIRALIISLGRGDEPGTAQSRIKAKYRFISRPVATGSGEVMDFDSNMDAIMQAMGVLFLAMREFESLDKARKNLEQIREDCEQCKNSGLTLDGQRHLSKKEVGRELKTDLKLSNLPNGKPNLDQTTGLCGPGHISGNRQALT